DCAQVPVGGAAGRKGHDQRNGLGGERVLRQRRQRQRRAQRGGQRHTQAGAAREVLLMHGGLSPLWFVGCRGWGVVLRRPWPAQPGPARRAPVGTRRGWRTRPGGGGRYSAVMPFSRASAPHFW